MAGSKPRSPDDWWALLQKFAGASDVSIADFCRMEGISVGSFYRWRNLLTSGQSATATEEPQPSFVELGSLAPLPTVSRKFDIRLELGDGIVLHLVRS
jgi:transposase-like protein